MFRRNKTIVTVSYAKKRRRKLFWRIILIVVAVLIVLGIFLYTIWRPALLISTITVEGVKFGNETLITQTVREVISGKYLYVLPKRNALLLPRRAIARALTEHEKAIDEIDLDLSGLTGLVVQVKEHQPFSRWCRTVVVNEQVVKSSECYMMTADGYIFANDQPQPERLAFDIRWYGLLDTDTPRGQQFIIDPPLSEWQQLVSSLATMSLETDSITARGNGEYEATFTTGQRILVNNKQSLERSLSNLRTVLQERARGSQATTTPFEYVDLRFGSKVYVK
jgi:cell division septal protein FtsQ